MSERETPPPQDEPGDEGLPAGTQGARPPSPSPYRPGARYSLFVGLVFLGLVAVAAINGARTDEGTLLGSEEVTGEPLAEFAVPDVHSGLELDANLAQDDCETARNPCPEDDRRIPACDIDVADAIRVCDLFGRPLVISFWFTSPQACVETQDGIYAVAAEYGSRVNFLSVAVRGDRDQVESIATERAWKVPVGWDRDGAVSNVYRVGICPTVAVARPGGIFETVLIGSEATPAALRDQLDALLAAGARGPGEAA